MPITPYLDGFKFDPETKRVMGVAFEMTLAALWTAKRTDLSKEAIAKKIIALAKEGMRDANLLCEWALDDLRKQPPEARAARRDCPNGQFKHGAKTPTRNVQGSPQPCRTGRGMGQRLSRTIYA